MLSPYSVLDGTMKNSSLSRTRWMLLILLVALSRLPFLFAGYGSDADAWLVAYSGSQFWNTGIYEVSRFPGYPLHEIIMAPFVVFGGAPLGNTITLFVAFALLFSWKQLAERQMRFPALSILCLAFAPLLWKNSATMMDYVWGLLAMILALHAALNKKTWLSGILIGIAAGFRPFNILLIIPLVVLLLSTGFAKRSIFVCIVAALLSSASAFLPVILRYGFNGWIAGTESQTADITLTLQERLGFFLYRSIYAIGPLALGCLVFILFRVRKALNKGILNQNPLVVTSIAGVATYLLLFLFFPLEKEYLLPALPFLLIIVDALSPRTLMTAFTFCLLSFAFVNPDVVRHNQRVGTPGLNVHEGFMIDNWNKRREILEMRKAVGSLPIRGKAVLMTGGDAVVWFENPYFEVDTSAFWRTFNAPVARRNDTPEVRVIGGLHRDELTRVQHAGYTVYCYAPVRGYLEKVLGYTMNETGISVVANP